MSEKDFWADFLRVESISEIELNLSLEDFNLLEFMVDRLFISLKKEMEFLLDIKIKYCVCFYQVLITKLKTSSQNNKLNYE